MRPAARVAAADTKRAIKRHSAGKKKGSSAEFVDIEKMSSRQDAKIAKKAEIMGLVDPVLRRA